MTQLAEFVECLYERHQERRAQPRTQVEMPVDVLVVRHTKDASSPELLAGIVHDVSSTGARLSTAEPLSPGRVWLKFVDFPGPVYVEASVARTTPPEIPMAYSYGVQFARMMKQDDFQAWVGSCLEHEPTVSRRRPVPEVLKVNVGDTIDLDSLPIRHRMM